LSSKIEKMRESGQINFMISRTDYKKYLKSILKADSLYILSMVTISIFMILLLGFIVTGKFSGPSSIGIYDVNCWGFLGIVIFQIFIISLFAILITEISAILNVWIHNKIVIKTLPFSVFTLVPMIISSTIGNIFITFGNIIVLFVPFKGLRILTEILTEDVKLIDILGMLLPFVFYIILFIFLYKINVKKYTENCL
jgi:hypothetical protein